MSQPESLPYADSKAHVSWTVAVGFIALRVIGIYLVVHLINSIIFMSDMLWRVATTEGVNSEAIRLAVSLAMPVLSGCLLIVFARPIAMRLLNLPGLMPARVDADGVVALAAVVIGLWTMVQAIPHLVPELFVTIENARTGPAGTPGGSGWIARHWWLIVYSLQFIVGLLLFLRPGWIVGQFRRHARPVGSGVVQAAPADEG